MCVYYRNMKLLAAFTVLGLCFFWCRAQLQNLSCKTGCSCLPDTLRCINVKLTRIPSDIIWKNVTVLDLRYNSIKVIKKNDFDNLQELENLFLGNNNIEYIEPGAFSTLKKLKHLYLFSNNLSTIEDGTFSGLVKLQQLYLQNNAITDIAENAFIDLMLLNRLYLHRNKLTDIPLEIPKLFGTLTRLRLEFNQFYCTCKFLRAAKDIGISGNIYLRATCSFENQEKHVSSLDFSDIGCYKPQFIEKPSKHVAAIGSIIELPCKANGYPVPSIYWLKDGGSIKFNNIVTVDDDKTLIINSFTLNDVGYYQCIIENVVGKDFAGANLMPVDEEGVPIFIKTPSDVDGIKDSIVLFNCRAGGYPRPSISWIKNGEKIEDSKRFKLLANGDLEIKKLHLTDSGYYTCHADNTVGGVAHSARLIVKASPEFVRRPEHQYLLDGDTASFECRAMGYPPPAIAWQKEGRRLPSDGRHVVLPSGTLRILYVNKNNEGVYECQAINVIGVISANANLTIRARVKPKITNRPADMTIQSGNTIFMTCISEGAPKPIVTWIRNGVQVTSGNRFTVNSADGTLEIKDVGKVDEGPWECVARNSIGFASEGFSITVLGHKDGNYEGDQFVLQALERARSEVDRAIEITKLKLTNFSPQSPGDLLALFRFPSPDAVKIARSAEIFEIALELIQKSVDSGILHEGMEQTYNFNGLVSPEHIRLLANLSGCTAHHRLVNCTDLCFHKKYRTYDGSCNNLNHPMWGASLTPFTRLLIPNYENGFNTPFGWNKTDLPSARKISLDLISSVNVTSDEEFTHMMMQWGQFMDHDLDFTVTSPSISRFNDGKSCRESCDNEQPCFPIKIPENDPRIKRYKCMEFTRSSAVCGSGSTSVFFDTITPRQQINQITSFMDASNVYGSTQHDAEDLRSYDNDDGLLKQGIHFRNGKFLLPFNQDTPIDCQVNKSESKVPCFLAGDHRANEQLGLLSMHTLWMRQHNRLATELKRLNPHWNGEKIYQESRKIVGAQMQHISFNDWLPKILGKDGMKLVGKYRGYDPTVEPAIFNAFATAAFRFGHTLIQPVLARLNESFQDIPEGSLPLHKAFFSPYRVIEEGGIDPLIRGLFGVPLKDRKSTSQPFNAELTERLFKMAHAVALDLGALNIQRGRDHGLPTYNSWRQFCNLTVAVNFDDFKEEIRNADLRMKLEQTYKNIDNIDLFVGGILEDPLPGSRLGPTFMCLISLQMKKIKYGDRLWYENPGVFKPDQLIQIKQTTLARIICDNSDDIRHVQTDVFKRVSSNSEYIPCYKQKSLDLRFWKECCTENESCKHSNRANTLSNFVRNSRSIAFKRRRAKRSLDSDWFNVTESRNRKHDVKYGRVKIDTKLDKRMEKLEKKVAKLSKQLERVLEEIFELKKEGADDVGGEEASVIKRQCVENGIVRDHGETWFDATNRKCACADSETVCL